VRLGELGQAMIGASLFVQRLLQQPRFVEAVEPARVRARAAVRGNFVMLDALSDADNRRVADVVCRRLIQTFVGFLNNPREARARLRAPPLAPVREDQFEPLEVEPRLVAVFFERFTQFRRAGGLCEARQRPEHLCFSVAQVAKLVEVQVLQRGEGH
jgi:hypothetical protein